MTVKTREKVTYLTVVGLLNSRNDAEVAWSSAIANGCLPADLTVVVAEDHMHKHFVIPKEEMGKKMMEEAGAGGAVGVAAGALGGAAAALATMGAALIIPGLGLAIAGPLAAAVLAAGAGGAVGALAGALAGAGISEAKAKHVEKHLKKGGIVIVAHTTSERVAKNIEEDWKNCRIDVLL